MSSRAVFVLALFAPGSAFAATWTVGGESMSFDDALTSAEAGDTISVANGSYGDVVIDKAITLMGSGDAAVFSRVEVRGADAVLQDLTLSGLEIQDGAATGARLLIDGAGAEATGVRIAAEASGHFTDLEVRDFRRGGVEVAEGATFAVDGARIHGCRNEHGGAVMVAGGTATMSSVTFRSNAADGRGGHVSVEAGTVTIRGSRFVDGEAVMGGAISAQDSQITVSESGFARSRAWGDGGAIHVAGGDASIADVQAYDSNAEQGGFASFVGSQVTVSDLTTDHATAWLGGHVHTAGGVVDMTRTWMTAGTAGRGGAVAVESGTFTGRNAAWTGNDGTEAGGALYVRDGDVDLRFAVLAQNVSGLGAAVAAESGATSLSGVIAFDNAGSEALLNAGGAMSFHEGLVYGPEIDVAFGAVDVSGLVEGHPRFTNEAGGDWTLRATSPALDRAVAGELDLDGTVADMGAFGGGMAWQLPDEDGDGWAYGRDCDDTDATVHEGAADSPYDGVDADCDESDDFDADRDGYTSSQFGGDDCDDFSALTHPGADERSLDAYDQDCDGLLDVDADGDGFSEGVDCDDSDASVWPGADDSYYDGVDSDCAGNDDFDADADGDAAESAGGTDCDDLDPTVHGDAVERADDGIDQDCDGVDLVSEDEQQLADEGGEANMVGEAASSVGSDEPNRVGVTLGCTHTGAPGSGGAGFTVVLALAGLTVLRGRR